MASLSFRAAVFEGPGRDLQIQEVELPIRPPRGEVLVKLEASGVCHSDFHIVRGDWSGPTPMVLGHEGAGVVQELGEGVSTVQVGDHVILSWTPSCRVCAYCVSGRPVLCDLVNKTSFQHLSSDGTTRLRRSGQSVHSFLALGTFGEYVMVPESGAISIRKDAPFAQAALVGCAVTTGIGAVTRTAKIDVGASVLVVGCGGVGLNIIQGARLAGARQIIAADVSDAKLKSAQHFGATHTVNSSSLPLVESVRDLTGGKGVEFAFEAIGLPKTIELAYQALARGGTVVVVGQAADGATISIDPFVMSDQEKTLKGSNYGSSRPSVDFPRIIDLYMSGKLDLDSLITTRTNINGINDAFAAMGRGEGIRAVIEYGTRG